LDPFVVSYAFDIFEIVFRDEQVQTGNPAAFCKMALILGLPSDGRFQLFEPASSAIALEIFTLGHRGPSLYVA